VKIITKKVAGGFTAKVYIPADFECITGSKRYRSVIGVYPTRNSALRAAEDMIELNPASFGHPGDSPRVSSLKDIDDVRRKTR